MAEEEVRETAKQPEQQPQDDGLLECPCCRKRTL